MGGLARKATVIDEVLQSGEPVAIVDAGNLFFKKDQLSPGVTSEIAQISAETIVKSFNIIGCDAFSPGSQDFALGLPTLRELEKNANFPFISANIKDQYGLPLFRPYQIVSKGGLSIGFIGLASKFDHADVMVEDPFMALNGIVDEVDAQTDLIVLLFNAEEKDMNILHRNKDLPIDLVYRSKSRKRSNDGGTKTYPTYSAGDRGKYMYDVKVTIHDKGMDLVDVSGKNNVLKNATKRLERMQKQHPEGTELKVLFKDDPQTLARIKSYERQIEESNYALENAINSLELTKHELNKTIADKPEVLLIVDKGKEKIVTVAGPGADIQGRLPGDPHHGHGH